MEQIRAFIAIEIPQDLKLGLAALKNHLSSNAPSGVKWVNPKDIHLTLKFLGNIRPDIAGAITEAIEESARSIPPFSLYTTELGTFPNPKRARVAWLGLGGDLGRLQNLQENIEANLKPLGFQPESRPFTPHLTLARLGDGVLPASRQAFGEAVASTVFEPMDITVDSVSLIKSQMTRSGAIYSLISSVKLVKG